MKNIFYILTGLTLISCNVSTKFYSSRIKLDTETIETEMTDKPIDCYELSDLKDIQKTETQEADSIITKNEQNQNQKDKIRRNKTRLKLVTSYLKKTYSVTPQKTKFKSHFSSGSSSDEMWLLILAVIVGLVFLLWLFGVIDI